MTDYISHLAGRARGAARRDARPVMMLILFVGMVFSVRSAAAQSPVPTLLDCPDSPMPDVRLLDANYIAVCSPCLSPSTPTPVSSVSAFSTVTRTPTSSPTRTPAATATRTPSPVYSYTPSATPSNVTEAGYSFQPVIEGSSEIYLADVGVYEMRKGYSTAIDFNESYRTISGRVWQVVGLLWTVITPSHDVVLQAMPSYTDSTVLWQQSMIGQLLTPAGCADAEIYTGSFDFACDDLSVEGDWIFHSGSIQFFQEGSFTISLGWVEGSKDVEEGEPTPPPDSEAIYVAYAVLLRENYESEEAYQATAVPTSTPSPSLTPSATSTGSLTPSPTLTASPTDDGLWDIVWDFSEGLHGFNLITGTLTENGVEGENSTYGPLDEYGKMLKVHRIEMTKSFPSTYFSDIQVSVSASTQLSGCTEQGASILRYDTYDFVANYGEAQYDHYHYRVEATLTNIHLTVQSYCYTYTGGDIGLEPTVHFIHLQGIDEEPILDPSPTATPSQTSTASRTPIITFTSTSVIHANTPIPHVGDDGYCSDWRYLVSPTPVAAASATPTPSPSLTPNLALTQFALNRTATGVGGQTVTSIAATVWAVVTSTAAAEHGTGTAVYFANQSLTPAPYHSPTASATLPPVTATAQYEATQTWIFSTPGNDERATNSAFGTERAATLSSIVTPFAGSVGSPAPYEGFTGADDGTFDAGLDGGGDGAVYTGIGLTGDSRLFAFDFKLHLTGGQCYTFLPAVDLKKVSIDRVRLCIQWVQFPGISIFGVRIPIESVLIYPLIAMYRWLWRYE